MSALANEQIRQIYHSLKLEEAHFRATAVHAKINYDKWLDTNGKRLKELEEYVLAIDVISKTDIESLLAEP